MVPSYQRSDLQILKRFLKGTIILVFSIPERSRTSQNIFDSHIRTEQDSILGQRRRLFLSPRILKEQVSLGSDGTQVCYSVRCRRLHFLRTQGSTLTKTAFSANARFYIWDVRTRREIFPKNREIKVASHNKEKNGARHRKRKYDHDTKCGHAWYGHAGGAE